MDCLRCEVTRARVIAAGMALVGKSQEEIAAFLTATLGAVYLVDNGVIFRSNNPVNIRIR